MMELWLRVQAFFDILLTRNVIVEIATVTVCLWVGWMVGAALRKRFQRGGNAAPMALTWTYFASEGFVVVTPVVLAWVLVLLSRGLLAAGHFDVSLLDAGLHLIGAYVIVRVGALLFAASLGNKSWMKDWETRVALVIWLAIAAEYLGWLDPIVVTLDSIGISAGKSRITVWSILKLLFTLTLFVLAAVWISRWVERRLKKLSNLAPSTRIGIAKFANAFLIGLSILMGPGSAAVGIDAQDAIAELG